MKRFDYYIIKKFLYTFGLSISLILAIAVIFDFSEKIDNFIDNQAPTNLIIQDYYTNFIIHYGVVFSGLITFISVIFFYTLIINSTCTFICYYTIIIKFML